MVDGGPTSVEHVELETPTHRGDIAAALLCLAIALTGYFVLVPTFVYVPSRFAGTVNSPAFLPNLLFLALAGLSVIYLAFSIAALRSSKLQGRSRLSDWGLAAGTALICIGYVVAIYLVGMTLASALCVATTIFYYGERRFWPIATITIVLPILLWVFFVEVARVLFPPPLIPFFEGFLAAAERDPHMIARILDAATLRS